jgi:hypothetical protein
MGGAPKPIKVCLMNRGEDSETPWAHDLGPAPGRKGSRRVRLVNVPFRHAKPTWGDVIIVAPADNGLPTWDRDGVPWPQIGTRVAEDGGRWAMIVDYLPHADTPPRRALAALTDACGAHDIVCELAWPPRDREPGRAYLAVPVELRHIDAMRELRAAELPCELAQIHPPPVKPSKSKAKAKGRPRARGR